MTCVLILCVLCSLVSAGIAACLWWDLWYERKMREMWEEQARRLVREHGRVRVAPKLRVVPACSCAADERNHDAGEACPHSEVKRG